MRWPRLGSAVIVCVFLAGGCCQPRCRLRAERRGPARPPPPIQAVIQRYCVTCHNDRLETGGLSLQGVDIADVDAHRDVWEKVVRKMRAGAMPPRPRPRPDDATYAARAGLHRDGPRCGRRDQSRPRGARRRSAA